MSKLKPKMCKYCGMPFREKRDKRFCSNQCEKRYDAVLGSAPVTDLIGVKSTTVHRGFSLKRAFK